ncbi:MAG TPA: hypothetical protein VFZ16_03500 [Hyphomicrobiaceae bacterium]|nr:hypothetical protein [Hyphomicrobiaceae bacterium]
MLTKLLTTIVTVAFVVCGATVGLEALGLIFNVGSADPEQRIEAAVAKIEANLDPMNVPREPEVEALWPPSEHKVAVITVPHEEPQVSGTRPPAVAGQLMQPAVPGPNPVAVAASSADDTPDDTDGGQLVAEPALLGGPKEDEPDTDAAGSAEVPAPAVTPAPAITAPAATAREAPPSPGAEPAPAKRADDGQVNDRAHDRARPSASHRSRHRRSTGSPRINMVRAHSGPECPGCVWLEAVAAEPVSPSQPQAALAGDRKS